MTHAPRAIPVVAAAAGVSGREAARALIETTKPGITRLVTITAMVGYAMTALQAGPSPASRLLLTALACLIGTALSAGGANALNQWMEMARDRRMARTSGRPIPSGRLAPGPVAWFGGALVVAGVGVLAAGAGPAAALVSLTCAGVYVFLYTPLKPITAWNTLIGAVPGALPPLIGAAAASQAPGLGALGEPVGWALVALMMVWQLPHFFAIAWLYRADYTDGGFRMLSANDERGTKSAAAILGFAVLLIPASLTPAWAAPGLLGWVYAAIAGVLGLAFLWLCVRFAIDRSRDRARRVFLASIVHLPVLLVAMVGEAAVRGVW